MNRHGREDLAVNLVGQLAPSAATRVGRPLRVTHRHQPPRMCATGRYTVTHDEGVGDWQNIDTGTDVVIHAQSKPESKPESVLGLDPVLPSPHKALGDVPILSTTPPLHLTSPQGPHPSPKLHPVGSFYCGKVGSQDAGTATGTGTARRDSRSQQQHQHTTCWTQTYSTSTATYTYSFAAHADDSHATRAKAALAHLREPPALFDTCLATHQWRSHGVSDRSQRWSETFRSIALALQLPLPAPLSAPRSDFLAISNKGHLRRGAHHNQARITNGEPEPPRLAGRPAIMAAADQHISMVAGDMAAADALQAIEASANSDATSPMKCCCGLEECVFLKHNYSVLDSVEKDVHTAARMGQVCPRY